MSKALVIGGNGFIGSHLVDALVDLEWDVTVFDLQGRRYDSASPRVKFMQGDLNKEIHEVEKLIESADVDVVFHLGLEFHSRNFASEPNNRSGNKPGAFHKHHSGLHAVRQKISIFVVRRGSLRPFQSGIYSRNTSAEPNQSLWNR